MCLAVPGRIIDVRGASDGGTRMARVDFQGSRISASLIFTPEAGVGDWVLVHAGFAIRRLNEREARETWKYLGAEDLDEALGAGEAPAEWSEEDADPASSRPERARR